MSFAKELKEICESHGISSEAFEDIRNFVDAAIVKVFNANYSNPSSSSSSSSKKASSNSNTDICSGTLANGNPCAFKAKTNGFCGRHDPEKGSSKSSSSSSSSKASAKTSGGRKCGAVIKSTGKPCQMGGTTKPDGAKQHYCKRHSTDYEQYELEEPGLDSDSETSSEKVPEKKVPMKKVPEKKVLVEEEEEVEDISSNLAKYFKDNENELE